MALGGLDTFVHAHSPAETLPCSALYRSLPKCSMSRSDPATVWADSPRHCTGFPAAPVGIGCYRGLAGQELVKTMRGTLPSFEMGWCLTYTARGM